MSHVSEQNGQVDGASTRERVIVADNDGEKVVTLLEEKRDGNGALDYIVVTGTTGGRKFRANNGLSGGDPAEESLRRFTVNSLVRGQVLDLEGRPIKLEPKTQPTTEGPVNLRKGKKKKPKQKSERSQDRELGRSGVTTPD
jgi:hypothetical protein